MTHLAVYAGAASKTVLVGGGTHGNMLSHPCRQVGGRGGARKRFWSEPALPHQPGGPCHAIPGTLEAGSPLLMRRPPLQSGREGAPPLSALASTGTSCSQYRFFLAVCFRRPAMPLGCPLALAPTAHTPEPDTFSRIFQAHAQPFTRTLPSHWSASQRARVELTRLGRMADLEAQLAAATALGSTDAAKAAAQMLAIISNDAMVDAEATKVRCTVGSGSDRYVLGVNTHELAWVLCSQPTDGRAAASVQQ